MPRRLGRQSGKGISILFFPKLFSYKTHGGESNDLSHNNTSGGGVACWAVSDGSGTAGDGVDLSLENSQGGGWTVSAIQLTTVVEVLRSMLGG